MLRCSAYLLLGTLVPPPVEAVPVPGGGRGSGSIAVLLVTPVGVSRTGGTAGVVVQEEICRTAVSAAAPTAATTAPDVALRLQQELSVHCLQLQIVHAKHGGHMGTTALKLSLLCTSYHVIVFQNIFYFVFNFVTIFMFNS